MDLAGPTFFREGAVGTALELSVICITRTFNRLYI